MALGVGYASRGSHNPEFDAARVLLANGITGKLAFVDASTGRPRIAGLRITVDIEKAAKLTVKEGRNGPRFVKWQEQCPERPSTAEDHIVPPTHPPEANEAT